MLKIKDKKILAEMGFFEKDKTADVIYGNGHDDWYGKDVDAAISLLPDGTIEHCSDYGLLVDLILSGAIEKIPDGNFYTLEVRGPKGNLVSTSHSYSLDALKFYADIHEKNGETVEISSDGGVAYETPESVKKALWDKEKAEEVSSARERFTALANRWFDPERKKWTPHRPDKPTCCFIVPGEAFYRLGEKESLEKGFPVVVEADTGDWIGFASEDELKKCGWLQDESVVPLDVLSGFKEDKE